METTIEINGKSVTITLTKEQIKKINEASMKIEDRIKTWEDACLFKGMDTVKSLPYPKEENEFEAAMNGIFQMCTITEILCEGWKPDYSNTNQYKWYPYFRYNSGLSGFGFYASLYVSDSAFGASGARLVFPTEAKANYAGKQFISIWNKFLTK